MEGDLLANSWGAGGAFSWSISKEWRLQIVNVSWHFLIEKAIFNFAHFQLSYPLGCESRTYVLKMNKEIKFIYSSHKTRLEVSKEPNDRDHKFDRQIETWTELSKPIQALLQPYIYNFVSQQAPVKILQGFAPPPWQKFSSLAENGWKRLKFWTLKPRGNWDSRLNHLKIWPKFCEFCEIFLFFGWTFFK